MDTLGRPSGLRGAQSDSSELCFNVAPTSEVRIGRKDRPILRRVVVWWPRLNSSSEGRPSVLAHCVFTPLSLAQTLRTQLPIPLELGRHIRRTCPRVRKRQCCFVFRLTNIPHCALLLRLPKNEHSHASVPQFHSTPIAVLGPHVSI